MDIFLKRSKPIKILVLGFIFALFSTGLRAEGSIQDYNAVPPVISTAGSNDKPNILVILDNSNSMDEAATGAAVGSANAGSKSEIARTAIRTLSLDFTSDVRVGLMTYQQDNIVLRQLHNALYDASYDPDNYAPGHTQGRDSLKKRYRVPNTSNGLGNFIHYNIALPFYSGSPFVAFCHSETADFDNGSEDPNDGPWDQYDCYSDKVNTSDALDSGFEGYLFSPKFLPTDSDYALGILDFGRHLATQYIGPTWFSNSNPGRGMLHVEVADLDAAHLSKLASKLATSQFATVTDTPLRNAGLTPLEGTLLSAGDYFAGSLDASEAMPGVDTAPPSGNVCEGNDFVVLVTDGLPSVDASGNPVTSTAAGIAATKAAASSLLNQGIKTYVVGFALPEWTDQDLLNEIAVAGGTGNALFADDQSSLDATLESIVVGILNRTSSGSGPSVQTNSGIGDGAVYHATYIPAVEDTSGQSVSWVGQLNSLFIDQYGFLREDSNGNASLDNYATDFIIEFFYDAQQDKMLAHRKQSTQVNKPTGLTNIATLELDDIGYIWSARDQLAEISNVVTQRPFAENAATGRAIYSSLDGSELIAFESLAFSDINTINTLIGAAEAQLTGAQETQVNAQAAYEAAVNNYEQVRLQANGDTNDPEVVTAQNQVNNASSALVSARQETSAAQAELDKLNTFANSPDYHRYLNMPSVPEAQQLVEYIRGKEIDGFRNRTVDWGDGSKVWRLGDIVHSTPVAVGAPNSNYMTTHRDATYAEFANRYTHRRKVIYTGANDGMLHAFNAGFWDDGNKRFDTANTFVQNAPSATEHPLGTELWGYIPKAALPHLKWLKDPSYPHTYYVDGEPLVFDANIFEPSAQHPHGWGTVLVIGMRFGGGDITVETDSYGATQTLSSSYAVFDITDPESPPSLIAEISHPDLNFTVNKPTLVKARKKGSDGSYTSPEDNAWYLAFGSGPDELDGATSSSEAKLFVYDLNNREFLSGFPKVLANQGYLGEITAADLNNDFVDDVLYFGVNTGNAANPSGRVERLVLKGGLDGSWNLSDWFGDADFETLFDHNRTTVAAPTVVPNKRTGRKWVLFGTGRYFVTDDNVSDQRQDIYGVMEPVDNDGELTWGSVSPDDLLETTDISVDVETGKLTTSITISNGGNSRDIETHTQLASAINELKSGWHRSLRTAAPSGRVTESGVRVGNTTFFVENKPSADVCSPEGTRRLYFLDFRTGTAAPGISLSSAGNNTINDGFIDMGEGFGAGLTHGTYQTQTIGSSPTVIKLLTQTSKGEVSGTEFTQGLIGTKGRQSWRQLDIPF